MTMIVSSVTDVAASTASAPRPVIDVSPLQRVDPAGCGVVHAGAGEGGGMQQSDREQQVDDDSTARPTGEDPRPQQAPVIRVLANPRRVRRA